MRRWAVWLAFFVATCAVAVTAWVAAGGRIQHWVASQWRIERVEPETISGRVVDVEGRPVAGIRVVTRSRQDLQVVVASSASDAKGRFTVDTRRQLGPYLLSLWPSGLNLHFVPAGGGSFPEVPGLPERAAIKDLLLTVDAKLRPLGGRVVNERGAPVSATILVRQVTEGPVGELRLLTGTDGRFRTTLVPPGRYLVEVVAESPHREHDVHLEAGQTDALIVLSDVTTLEGTLDGFPSASTVQLIVPDAPSRELHVDGDRFTVPSVPRGDVIVGAFGGSAFDFQTVHVDPARPATAHLARRPVGEVTGDVLSNGRLIGETFDGPESPDAMTCVWTLSVPASDFGPIPIALDAHGRFAFDAPVGERLEVVCRDRYDGYGMLYGKVTLDEVRGDQPNQLSVSLSRSR